jgi:putative endonuclease
MAEHNEIGKKGEALAKDFLQKKGYDILSINYRFKQHELDIVARIGNDLVIVEVKTRQNKYLADPTLMIPKTKQKGIISAANAYIHEHEVDLECRFDIITVLMNNGKTTFDHIEDAFFPV